MLRLTTAYAFAKDAGNSPEEIISDLRARLVPVRPSALETRGEPPLAEIGSLVYGLSDWHRFHPYEWPDVAPAFAEAARLIRIYPTTWRPSRLALLQQRRLRELETTSHSASGEQCRRCELLDVDTNDADALERVLVKETR
jgi:hypothetical protein